MTLTRADKRDLTWAAEWAASVRTGKVTGDWVLPTIQGIVKLLVNVHGRVKSRTVRRRPRGVPGVGRKAKVDNDRGAAVVRGTRP